MTPKGIAKRTVKDTGKAMVEDIRRPSGGHLQNTLYPNLLDQPGPSTSNLHTPSTSVQYTQKN